MVYLVNKNIIFIRPKKTASTVLDFAFASNTDSTKDIITPDSVDVEIDRIKMNIPYPQNWGIAPGTNILYNNYMKQLEKFVKNNDLENPSVEKIQKELHKLNTTRRYFYEHIPLRELRKKLTPPIYDKIHKVTVVRHPYEFVVSYAWMRYQRYGNYNSLEDAINGEIYKEKESNDRFYFIDNKPGCQTYLRYENLIEDTEKLEKTYDLKNISSLLKTTFLRNQYRTDRTPAKEILTEKHKYDIQKLFRKQFDFFSYDT